MLVFIDESGDAGFKVDKGASPNFVAAMVIFETNSDATQTQKTIEQSEARRLHKPEFKFNKCSNDIRDAFFRSVANYNFSVRAVVVRKALIFSPRLRSDKESFYNYFVSSMLRYDNDILRNARVVIDGSGDREFRRNLNTQFRRKVGEGVIADVRFKDSKSDVLVQLADMCAGAIARSYRTDRPNPMRWRRMLGRRINDVWDFR